MTERIQFIVPVVPVAQPRARATIRASHAAVYEASSGHAIHAFKASVRLAARDAYQGPPLQGPLQVDVLFVLPRPRKLLWKTKPMPRLRHTIKPDRDNLDKGVLDSLRGTMFIDDCQVCCGTIEKWIAAGDEQPFVGVTIVPLAS